MIKVIVWGSCVEYESFYKFFEPEVIKGNMKIEAIAINEDNLITSIDGIKVIKIEDILLRSFDYLIDMNRQEHDTVKRILELLNIPFSRVISAKVFRQPFFDLRRWIAVKESKVSIIANTCWGGAHI